MVSHLQNPFIVQGDMTVLAEVHSPLYENARDQLARFAELVKSPEHMHTYRMTPLSIWNAAAAGYSCQEMMDTLQTFSKYEVPRHVFQEMQELASRFGKLKIYKAEKEGSLLLEAQNEFLAEELVHHKEVGPYLSNRIDQTSFCIPIALRGKLKIELIRMGWPAEDLAGYIDGEKLSLSLRKISLSGRPFDLRDYQKKAAQVFYDQGSVKGGAGVIVLPCGAGKTIVGISVLSQVGSSVLILTTSVSAVRQWKSEILDKTSIDESLVGEYSGHVKELKPITISTYQILTHRKSEADPFLHFRLFSEREWGLIIYDEVHVLPAPVFQITAEIQSKRRLGLTATLVREDGKETEVFALIGPKKFDIPWKVLEKENWIAKALCLEVRIPLPESIKMKYALADRRDKFRIASENPDKFRMVKKILKKHQGLPTLIIGQYIEQLEKLAKELDLPLIDGKTPQKKRDLLFQKFKEGKITKLVASKIANFALDLPDAQLAIQISGTYGSRQEEAQRLGRILRPKSGQNRAYFYTLVSQDTNEMDFSRNRQLFLTEQGYAYEICYSKDFS